MRFFKKLFSRFVITSIFILIQIFFAIYFFSKLAEKYIYIYMSANIISYFLLIFIGRMKDVGKCTGFDVTKDYLTNPTLRSKLSDSKQGWETFTITQLGWTTSPAWGTDLLEIWNCDFEISQTLTDLPNGKYKIHVQAFYRSGKPETAVLFGNDDKVSLTPLKK